MADRLSGQDTSVSILVGNQVVADIDAIKSFDVTWKMSLKTEEYVGETSPRKDDFFEGMSGRIEFDLTGLDAVNLAETIKSRALVRTSATKISIKTTLQFPDGDRCVINIPNAFFADIPLNIAGRTEYGKMTLNWEAENGKVVSR
jgi:hypothetical protein